MATGSGIYPIMLSHISHRDESQIEVTGMGHGNELQNELQQTVIHRSHRNESHRGHKNGSQE